MNAIEQIRSSIDQDVFDYQQLMLVLTNYQKPRDLLTGLLKNGRIIRIRKGLYIFGEAYRHGLVPVEMLANLIYGPSLISLDYALSWYGLIPERVYEITSVATGRSRVFNTPFGRYSYRQTAPERLSLGARGIKHPAGNWLICDPVKALADKVWNDKRFHPSSASAYSDYLFEDLRIDEETLAGFCNKSDLNDLARIFDARKITLLTEFLLKHYTV